MKLDRLTIVRSASSELASQASRVLQSPDALANARVLKSEGKAWVRLIEVAGEKIVVKCRPLHTIRRRVQSLLGMGHAHRQWRGAALLKQSNILTAEPVLIARARINSLPCELLVLEYIPGPTLLELLNDIARARGPSVRQQHAIAQAVGASVFTLYKSKLHNRDHKPSNLVVVDKESLSPRIAVIDCVGVSRSRNHPCGMLADLVIEPLGCACPPRLPLMLRAVRECLLPEQRAPRLGFDKSVFYMTTRIIEKHPDPRPKTDPLSTPPS